MPPPPVLDVKDKRLKVVIKEISNKGADWIHVDVIDWKRTPANGKVDIVVSGSFIIKSQNNKTAQLNIPGFRPKNSAVFWD